MQDISMSDAELLKYAIENGMLDTALVQEKIEMQKRKETLEKHNYKIWEGKDGNWYTYICGKDNNRVLKKRKTKEAIENFVIQRIKEEENDPTVENVFNEWISNKLSREDISKSTRDRYERQYEQCFSLFGKRKIKSISEFEVEEFILNSIYEQKLTPKGYSNLRTLIYGIFKYAKKKGLVQYSITEIVEDMEIPKKAFRRTIKEDNEEVFMIDEISPVIDFLKNNQDIVNLGILLLFKTGLRIGELAAIKKCDISDSVIHICRTEISYLDDSGKMVYEVRDFPKTEAGIRDVILPSDSYWILEKIKKLNPLGEYLFMKSGKRIKASSFRKRLYLNCDKLKLRKKSPHKIRKTYGSILIDSGCEESLILSQMGHTNIRTTKKHYYRNRRSMEEMREKINSVAGL